MFGAVLACEHGPATSSEPPAREPEAGDTITSVTIRTGTSIAYFDQRFSMMEYLHYVHEQGHHLVRL